MIHHALSSGRNELRPYGKDGFNALKMTKSTRPD